MMERLFTIGVYGFDPESFLGALEQAQIDVLLDIRRRRGVRGSEYAFANAKRLQRDLESKDITYRHVIQLAPEEATRELQSRDDAAARIPRRQRAALGEAFVASYTRLTLEPFDWDAFIEELKLYRRPVLFCVERLPEACHRSLAAERLARLTGVPITHLAP